MVGRLVGWWVGGLVAGDIYGYMMSEWTMGWVVAVCRAPPGVWAVHMIIQ